MSYRYNGRGERVHRQTSDKTVYTVFDEGGRWVGDYEPNGWAIREMVWLGDLPVGLLARVGGITRLFHVEPDASGTPRTVIDPTRGSHGTVVWRWGLGGSPFGESLSTELCT